jgi:hypothetical protein
VRQQVLALLAITFLVGIVAPAISEQPHVAREEIEWCDIWVPEANGTNLPRVLLIGDSITRAYYPNVVEQLKGKASVARLATSKSLGDPALLAEVALVLDQYRFDIVHFNNGLHGMDYSEAEYQRAFPQLLATIRKHAPKARLILATSTPMRNPENLAAFTDDTTRVKARNSIAEKCATQQAIPIDDLFALVEHHPEYYASDGVHFNAKGTAAQAAQVSRHILKSLK